MTDKPLYYDPETGKPAIDAFENVGRTFHMSDAVELARLERERDVARKESERRLEIVRKLMASIDCTLAVDGGISSESSRLWGHREAMAELDAPIVPTFWGARRETTDGLLLLLHEACDRARIPRVPFHALRHTCGSLLIEAGVDLVIVSRILRHASVAITERVYIHVHDRQLVRAADQLEAFLSQAANAPATANGEGT